MKVDDCQAEGFKFVLVCLAGIVGRVVIWKLVAGFRKNKIKIILL